MVTSGSVTKLSTGNGPIKAGKLMIKKSDIKIKKIT